MSKELYEALVHELTLAFLAGDAERVRAIFLAAAIIVRGKVPDNIT